MSTKDPVIYWDSIASKMAWVKDLINKSDNEDLNEIAHAVIDEVDTSHQKIPLVVDCTVFNKKKNRAIKTMPFPIWVKNIDFGRVTKEMIYDVKSQAEHAFVISIILSGAVWDITSQERQNFISSIITDKETKILKDFHKSYRVMMIWDKPYILKK